ncbi:MAG TPA: thioredoxin domain-containing protein, partial [Pyrinomonadaceae bacterium]|nr:thioredoxin domain-containing protein [Pyrinomonadaceae bacterium]
MQNYRPFLIIALVLAIAIISGALLLRSSRKQISTVAPGSQPPFPAGSRNEPGIPAQTVVTLEEFGDYQCSPCGELHPSLKQLKQQLGPNLNFVFRNLPLTTIHKNSLAAAQAAEAARMQNRFWE